MSHPLVWEREHEHDHMTVVKECCKEHLEPIHAFLGKKDLGTGESKKFLAGQNITFVDFVLFEFIDKCNDRHMWDGTFFQTFPLFEALLALRSLCSGIFTLGKLVL